MHIKCGSSPCPSWMNNNYNIQYWAIRHEFEYVGPTPLKDPLGARWALMPTLRWVGSWFFRELERRFHGRESNYQPLRLDLGTSPLSSHSRGSSWTKYIVKSNTLTIFASTIITY